jgi:predicted ester cyclase
MIRDLTGIENDRAAGACSTLAVPMPLRREDALEIVRRFRAAGGRRDTSALRDLYADDAVAISPVFGEVRGGDAIAATWATMFTTFPDITIDISDVLVDDDRLAILGRIGATDRIGWFGLSPTGSRIDYRIVLLLTTNAEGRIVRDERIYDNSGVIERLEKTRLDKELRTAAEVQRALLSRTAHAVRFCEMVGHSIPCRAIGGDFFEFAELPSGAVAVAIGDVSGKGPAAALLAALLQGMIAVEAPRGGGPAETVTRLNERLAARGIEPRFATLVYGVIAADGTFCYTNAGHNPPVVLTKNGPQRLTRGGPILGAFPRATFDEDRVALNAGDTVVLFTDGVTEARSAGDEEFGEERLVRALAADASAAPAALLTRAFAAVRDFSGGAEQSDDVTVAVARILRTTLG